MGRELWIYVNLAFYLDHHAPAAIAVGLRPLGVDLLTAKEDDRADWDDDQLLERATDLGRVVFTQDRHFLVLAADWHKTAGNLQDWPTDISSGSPSGVPSTIWR